MSLALMLALNLACGLGGPPAPLETSRPGDPAELLPLQAGARWEYSIRKREGRELRLFLIPLKGPSAEPDGRLILEIDDATSGGRFPARLTRVQVDGGREVLRFELVEGPDGPQMIMDGEARPAVVAEVPARALSSERLPCVVNVLGGVEGRCPATWGGPLGAAPLPEEGLLRAERRHWAGEMVVSVLLGLTVLTSEVVEVTGRREAFTGGPQETRSFPLWEAWQGGSSRSLASLKRALRRTPADAESLAAIALKLFNEDRREALLVGVPLLPEAERFPVLRAVLPEIGSEYPRARVLAQLSGALPALDQAGLAALLAQASDEEEAQAWRDILENPNEALLLGYAEAEREVDFPEALRPHLERRYPSAAEIEVLVRSPGGGQPTLSVLTDTCPPERRIALLAAWWDDLYLEDTLALLRASPDEARALPLELRRAIVERLGPTDEPAAGEAARLLGL